MSDQLPEGSQEEPKDTPPAETPDPQGTETPAGEAPADGTPKDELDELPEWARKELRTVRSEAAARRVNERALQQKLEGAVSPEEHERIVKELRDSLAESSRKVLVHDVVKEFKLPDDADTAEFLTATDEDGLKKQAEKLAKLLSINAPKNDDAKLPEPLEPRGGKDPYRDSEPSTEELRGVLNRKKRRF